MFLFQNLYAGQLKVEVSAPSAILINADTGRILYEKNAHLQTFPASTTKIATALYALEKKTAEMDHMITVSQDAVAAVSPAVRRSPSTKHPSYRLEFGGTHMGLKAGEQLSLRTLIYGLMLPSGNDAANVIAEHVSGNIPAFIQELNAFLKEKECLETQFYNPHGLPHPDHKTSAYDLAKMTRLAMQHPLFCEVVKSVRYKRPQTNKQPESILLQHNALLREGKFFYPKAIGVKTGWTVSAGYNLVAAAQDENRRLIAVLLNCSENAHRFKDAIALFDAAFQEAKISRKLIASEYEHFTVKIQGAAAPLEAALVEDLQLSYYPSEEPEFKVVLHWNDFVLPIQKGDFVGEIQLIDLNGNKMKTVSLYATKDVKKNLWQTFFDHLKLLIPTLDKRITLILLVFGILSLIFLLHALKASPQMTKTEERKNE